MTQISLKAFIAGSALIALAACEPKPQPWDEDTYLEYEEVMRNAGTSFAVHDICMPMILEDNDVKQRVALEAGAKRFAELQSFDTEAEYNRMVDFLTRKGGSEDDLEALTAAYDRSYDEAVEQISTLEQCETTLIDFHNTILNAGVREL